MAADEVNERGRHDTGISTRDVEGSERDEGRGPAVAPLPYSTADVGLGSGIRGGPAACRRLREVQHLRQVQGLIDELEPRDPLHASDDVADPPDGLERPLEARGELGANR